MTASWSSRTRKLRAAASRWRRGKEEPRRSGALSCIVEDGVPESEWPNRWHSLPEPPQHAVETIQIPPHRQVRGLVDVAAPLAWSPGSSSVSTLIGFAGLRVPSRPRTSSGLRGFKSSSEKESRPSGDRQARVRWAPSDGPASDRRPLAQMAPAPSEPRATTFSSRAPAVHRPFGLFSAAADLLVPAQVAHPRAPDPRAARTDRASRESVEAGAVTLRLCLHCGRHYHSGTGVRDRCGDCTGGGRGRRAQGSHTPQLAIGEKHRTTMKSHSSEPSRKHSTRGFASCQRG